MSLTELKKNLKTDKLVIGTQQTLKHLKQGDVAIVYLTMNCPDDVRADVAHYVALSGAQVMELEIPNEEFGTICKKPFSVSVAALLK